MKLLEFHTGHMIQKFSKLPQELSVNEGTERVVGFSFGGAVLVIDLGHSGLGRFVLNQKLLDENMPWPLSVRPQKYRELHESHQKPKFRAKDSVEDIFLIKNL